MASPSANAVAVLSSTYSSAAVATANSPALLPPPPAATRQDRRNAQYWEFRRDLWVWPVKGPTYLASMKEFLRDKLKFSDEEIAEFGHMEVDKYFTPRSKILHKATFFLHRRHP